MTYAKYILNFREVKYMPGRDGTGPLGRGALTGRGLGDCEGSRAGYAGRAFGFGRGRGMRGCGFGRGMGGWTGPGRGYGLRAWYADESGVSGKEALNEQKNALERQLEAIQARLDGLSEE